jgi:hypothetical protein
MRINNENIEARDAGILALRRQGKPIRAIASELHCGPNTVMQILSARGISGHASEIKVDLQHKRIEPSANVLPCLRTLNSCVHGSHCASGAKCSAYQNYWVNTWPS